MKKTIRAKRSFVPAHQKPVKHLVYRQADAKFVGFEEPIWPSAEEQKEWSPADYQRKLGEAYTWYSYCEKMEHGLSLAIAALSASGHRPKLIEAIKNSRIGLPLAAAWMIRMIHLGMIPTFTHKRFLAKELRKCIKDSVVSETAIAENTNKPNIQDYISAKLKKVKGEIDFAFDEFINSGYKESSRTVMNIVSDPVTAVPGNRMKDLVEYAEQYLKEYRLALAGKHDGYEPLGKRQLKAAIAWWETAINDITEFGAHKKSSRKPRKKKEFPSKIVGKLKFLKSDAKLKLESFDPTKILKSSEIWIFNVKTRKLGHYVARNGATFEVKGTRLLNLDTTKSVQKTLRKPVDQLKQFNALGKPGAIKWFNAIRAVETKLRDALNKDSILLREVK